MKKLCIFAFLCMFLPAVLFSQTENWVYRYNGPANSDDGALAVTYGEDGNIYAAGYSTGAGTDRDFTVISLTVAGDTNWIYRYNGTANSHDIAMAVVYGSDGNVYAAGVTSNTNTSSDFTVISLNSVGDTNWTYILNGQGTVDDCAYCIAYGVNGHIYAAGRISGIGSYWDYTVVSLDNTGSTNWLYTTDGPGGEYDCARDIIVGGNGNIYSAGYLWGWSNNMEFAMIGLNQSGYVIAYHLSLGVLANALAWGTDGYIYTAGYRTTSSNGYDILVKRHNPTGGGWTWYQYYDGTAHGNDNGYDVTYGTGDVIYVAGYSVGTSTNRDFTVLKYSQSGTLLWDFIYDAIDHSDDVANSIIVGADGNIYAGGYGSYNYMNDCIIISLTADGDTNWVYHYNGPPNSNDQINELAYDNAATLYAACTSVGQSTGNDFTIISLGTLGIEETQSVIDNHRVCPLAISPSLFRNSTKLTLNRFFTDKYIKLSLYDNLGRNIETIYSGTSPPLSFTYCPSPTVRSGIYYIVLETATERFTKTIVVLR